jgi:nucleotide-binding universal stress UspA family protein
VLPPRTVIVGYDGSRAAERALDGAARAAGSGGRIVVITAVPPPDDLVLEHVVDPPVAEPWRELAHAMDLLAEHDVVVSTRIIEADPVEALVEAAHELDAAMIVVGARGDSFLERTLRGSVSERLVSRAPCHLLVVR